jgi:hypothetical protein
MSQLFRKKHHHRMMNAAVADDADDRQDAKGVVYYSLLQEIVDSVLAPPFESPAELAKTLASIFIASPQAWALARDDLPGLLIRHREGLANALAAAAHGLHLASPLAETVFVDLLGRVSATSPPAKKKEILTSACSQMAAKGHLLGLRRAIPPDYDYAALEPLFYASAEADCVDSLRLLFDLKSPDPAPMPIIDGLVTRAVHFRSLRVVTAALDGGLCDDPRVARRAFWNLEIGIDWRNATFRHGGGSLPPVVLRAIIACQARVDPPEQYPVTDWVQAAAVVFTPEEAIATFNEYFPPGRRDRIIALDAMIECARTGPMLVAIAGCFDPDWDNQTTCISAVFAAVHSCTRPLHRRHHVSRTGVLDAACDLIVRFSSMGWELAPGSSHANRQAFTLAAADFAYLGRRDLVHRLLLAANDKVDPAPALAAAALCGHVELAFELLERVPNGPSIYAALAATQLYAATMIRKDVYRLWGAIVQKIGGLNDLVRNSTLSRMLDNIQRVACTQPYQMVPEYGRYIGILTAIAPDINLDFD